MSEHVDHGGVDVEFRSDFHDGFEWVIVDCTDRSTARAIAEQYGHLYEANVEGGRFAFRILRRGV